MTNVVEYDSNNSGGSWWLSDEDWKSLEAAGWIIQWKAMDRGWFSDGGRFLGALATNAFRVGMSEQEAIEEWESIVGQSSSEIGCECCGPPHRFSSMTHERFLEWYGGKEWATIPVEGRVIDKPLALPERTDDAG